VNSDWESVRSFSGRPPLVCVFCKTTLDMQSELDGGMLKSNSCCVCQVQTGRLLACCSGLQMLHGSIKCITSSDAEENSWYPVLDSNLCPPLGPMKHVYNTTSAGARSKTTRGFLTCVYYNCGNSREQMNHTLLALCLPAIRWGLCNKAQLSPSRLQVPNKSHGERLSTTKQQHPPWLRRRMRRTSQHLRWHLTFVVTMYLAEPL
jgi:hypothetical protein